MKGHDKKSLQAMTVVELEKQAREVEQKITTWTRERSIQPGKNTREKKFLRQRLAIIQTIIREKRILEAINNN